MKTPDESLSDSAKVQFAAMYEMFMKKPEFAEMMRSAQSGKTDSSSKENKSESARTEPTFNVVESPRSSLKATAFMEEEGSDREEQNDGDDELRIKNDFITEERSRSFAAQSKFYEASSSLQDLEYIDEDDLGIKLLLAECYIQLGRENKAQKNLEDVKKILIKESMCDIDEVIAFADDCSAGLNNLRALLLLRIAGDMFLNNPSLTADNKLGGIFRCAKKMNEPVEKMLNPQSSSKAEGIERLLQDSLKSLKAVTEGGEIPELDIPKLQSFEKKKVKASGRERVIAFDYGVAMMEDMLDKIRNLSGGDDENKALKQAILCNTINSHYSFIKQHSTSIKMLEIGIKYFERQFGASANQYQIYGTMLHNKGVELHNSERYKEAEIFEIAALEAKEHATDYNTEEERKKDFQQLRESLAVTRRHLKLG